MSAADDRRDASSHAEKVVLGSIKAVFGTRGWVKLHSETRPRDGIFDYAQWQIGRRQDWETRVLEEGRVQGPSLLAKLRGIDDRDAAERLIGLHIAVAPTDLPPPPTGSYYWRDLIGTQVVTADGELLGTVKALVETGGSDVLRVQGEREVLIPFVVGVYVLSVDLAAHQITVDWQQAED